MPMRGRIPKKRDVPCLYLSSIYTYNGKECCSVGSSKRHEDMNAFYISIYGRFCEEEQDDVFVIRPRQVARLIQIIISEK
jgi:hypothetical protein